MFGITFLEPVIELPLIKNEDLTVEDWENFYTETGNAHSDIEVPDVFFKHEHHLMNLYINCMRIDRLSRLHQPINSHTQEPSYMKYPVFWFEGTKDAFVITESIHDNKIYLQSFVIDSN